MGLIKLSNEELEQELELIKFNGISIEQYTIWRLEQIIEIQLRVIRALKLDIEKLKYDIETLKIKDSYIENSV